MGNVLFVPLKAQYYYSHFTENMRVRQHYFLRRYKEGLSMRGFRIFFLTAIMAMVLSAMGCSSRTGANLGRAIEHANERVENATVENGYNPNPLAGYGTFDNNFARNNTYTDDEGIVRSRDMLDGNMYMDSNRYMDSSAGVIDGQNAYIDENGIVRNHSLFGDMVTGYGTYVDRNGIIRNSLGANIMGGTYAAGSNHIGVMYGNGGVSGTKFGDDSGYSKFMPSR